MSDHSKRVVVTGVGAVTPAGNAHQLYEKSLKLESTLKLVHFDEEFGDGKPRKMGTIDVDLDKYIPASMQSFIPRDGKLAFASLAECIQDAKLNSEQLPNGAHKSLFLGSATIGSDFMEKIYRMKNPKISDIDPRVLMMASPRGVVQMLSIANKIEGCVEGISKASASGSVAIVRGYETLQRGDADIAFCGSADYNVAIFPMHFLNGTGRKYGGFFGTFDREPAGHVVPFCKPDVSNASAAGSAGIFLALETLDHAMKRNAHIYAEVLGGGEYFYSEDLVGGDKQQKGMKTVIKRSIESLPAGKAIDYSIQPATGHYTIDRNTYVAIHNFFGSIMTTTIEPIIGHTGASSGPVNALLACLALDNQTIIPTRNVDEKYLDPDFKLQYTTKPLKREINGVLVPSPGYGGFNAALAFSRYLN